MIIGIGIDSVSLKRFESFITHSPRIIRRAFSPNEQRLSIKQLAGNFAAKEALFKALTPSLRPLMSNCECLRNTDGKPYFVFTTTNSSFINEFRIHISITNEQNIITAMVLIEK